MLDSHGKLSIQVGKVEHAIILSILATGQRSISYHIAHRYLQFYLNTWFKGDMCSCNYEKQPLAVFSHSNINQCNHTIMTNI